MKRILICASRVSHILHFHLPYIEYFKSKGYEVHIAVQGVTDHPLIDKCYDLNFTKNMLSPENIKTIFQLKKMIQNGGYTIVYSNTTLAGVAVRAAMMLLPRNKPYYVHISHGYMFSEKNSIKQKVILGCEKLTKSPVDDLVVMNQEDYSLAEKYRLGKNLHYIYGMGLCAERFPEISEEKRRQVRQMLNADDHTKILLCVGEFSSRKNQMAIITAFHQLSLKHQKIILALAGDGTKLDKCKLLAETYELLPKIHFLGQQKDVNALYRSADLLISASKMEGLPFNVLEALYCGLPAVVSKIKGHTDLITNGENGLLFDENNINDIAEKLDAVLSDSALYDHLRASAALDERYLIENAKPELLKILDKEYQEKYPVYQ